MEDTNRYIFNSTDILFKVYHYRKPLIIITVAAAIASVIISLLITEKYKATVVLFPAPATSISKTYISPNSYSNDKSIFGEEEEVEQLLQVLNSDQIKQRIIEKYDLVRHWDIDTTAKYVQTRILEAYNSNISSSRTKFMAVEISVLDISPDTAALIANDISYLLDSVMIHMQKARSYQAFLIVEKEYNDEKKQINLFKDSLATIMTKGVYDFESQSEVINQAYAEALTTGNLNAARILKKQLDTISKYGSAYLAVRNYLEYEQENFSQLEQKYKEARVDAESEITHTYIIDKAYPPDKKAYPKRSIIVIVSTISSFVIGFLFIILLELYKDFRNRELVKKKD